MSVYDLSSGGFVEITEKTGIIQNKSMTLLEYVSVAKDGIPSVGTGITLHPNEKMNFRLSDDKKAYIRANVVLKYAEGQKALVNSTSCCGGGEVADDDDIDGILGSYDTATDADVQKLFGGSTT